MRLLLVATLSLCPACSFDDTIETTFDPCAPLTVVPSANTEAHEHQSIQDAVVSWDRVLPTLIDVGPSTGSTSEVSIRFEPGETYFRAIYLDKRGVILIGREKLAGENLALVVAHELGHAFGLWHVPAEERDSVMNVGNLDVAPSAEDAADLRALWDSCNEAR